MPNKCSVPGCTGNYRTGKKIQVFSFPKDGDALNKWLRAIPRKDFVPTSCTKVCVDHFDASCIERTTSYTDPRTGRVIEVALPVPRLRPGSVPTIFPGCPSYLSVSDHNTRETPDAKRSRKEASQLAHAVEESLASYEAEQERDRFSSLEELKARLQVVSVSPKWTVIHKEECWIFLNIIDFREPWLNASLTVFENLEVIACYQGSQIKNLGSTVVPDSVQKVSSLLEILNNLCMLSEERCSCRHLSLAIQSLLDKLEGSITEDKKEAVKFMKEQLLYCFLQSVFTTAHR
ncbi:THAP domain-containing protein 1-like [Rhipicephalus sanguineus]|nr:THAP domain-containing protein 1-like [Rhipicephalus sanguineus]